MLNRIATIGITLFWAMMMVQLARREVLPMLEAVRDASTPASYAELERLAAKPRADQMGVYLKDKRIGFSLSRLRMLSGELRMESRTNLRFSLSDSPAASALGTEALDMSSHFEARVRDGELLEFRATVAAKPGTAPFLTVDGLPIGNTLQLKIRQGDNTRIETVPFNARRLVSGGFGQAVVPRALQVGMRWPISSVNPFTGNLQISRAEVVGMEDVILDGNPVPAYVIEMRQGSNKMKMWVDDDGVVVKQTLFNFTFIREPAPADALERTSL